MRYYAKPTDERVEEAVQQLGRPIVRQYFFDKLENPEWLQSLRARGFFSSPPDPDLETGACPPWPEARYLARMAPAKPDDFVEILNEMKPTRNVCAVAPLLEGLLAIPPEAAARAISAVKRWVESRSVWFPQNVRKLIVRLAEGDLSGPALELARCFLQVLPDPDVRKKRRQLVAFLRARAVMDPYRYDEECRMLAPVLAKTAGVEAVKLFVELLSLAMEYEGHIPKTGRTDYSHIYRPYIEHPHHPGNSLVDSLVDGLRESVLVVLDQRPDEGAAALDAVHAGPSRLFDRIELYALSQHPHSYAQRIAERVRDFEDFDDLDTRREFRILLHAVFGELPEVLRDRYLRWVDTEPDVEAERKSLEEFTGEPVTEDDVRRRHRQQTLWRLRPIKDYLQGEWRHRYEQLADEFEEPDFPDEFAAHQFSWGGRESPISEAELLGKPVPEVVQYLREWQPPAGQRWEGPSTEGLSKALGAVVEKAAPNFATNAERFIGLPSGHVRALLSGLQKACAAGAALDWVPVLRLCQWVVSQPCEDDTEEPFDAEPKWGWARSAVMDLLKTGMEASPASIPFELRSDVWTVIQPITEDRDPTPEAEARDIGGQNDPLTLSFNVRRGQAMHLVMRYALWCRRCFEASDEADRLKAAGFDAMSEVRTALEAHLDPDNEPSLAVRSVYGRWYPWIAMLDPAWARANVDRMFPRQAEPHWEAAWDAYVAFCPLYGSVYESLSEQYAYAVERLTRNEKERVRPGNSDMNLTSHLVGLYASGKVPLRNSLFEKFWQVAPADLREHAFASVGHGFRRDEAQEDEEASEVTVSPEVMARLRALCEYRIEVAESGENADVVEELSGFGYWFDKNEFDGAWALRCLKRVLSLRGAKIQNIHRVLERLAELRQCNPGDVLECLRLIVVSGFHDYASWIEFVENIIRNCLLHPDSSARQAATDIAHLLIGLGHLQFREMLTQ